MEICKGCGAAENVDADVALCTLCIEWGEEILRDCEHRGSRMPEHMPSADPLFAHAVFNEFTPDEKAPMEKAGVQR